MVHSGEALLGCSLVEYIPYVSKMMRCFAEVREGAPNKDAALLSRLDRVECRRGLAVQVRYAREPSAENAPPVALGRTLLSTMVLWMAAERRCGISWVLYGD